MKWDGGGRRCDGSRGHDRCGDWGVRQNAPNSVHGGPTWDLEIEPVNSGKLP